MEKKYQHLLEVKDLYTSFNIPAGEVRSVNGVSFNLDKGKVLGIVGESGSGKSVTAYSIMQILQNPGRVVSGSILFKGKELLGLPNNQLQKIRGEKISIIFQDPMSSLNPVYTIGNQITEAIKLHPVPRIINALNKKVDDKKKAYEDILKKAENNQKLKPQVEKAKEEYRHAKYEKDNYAHFRALEMLKLVGINEPEKRLKQYPFEFSGGMLQRIMIAMSLVCEPDLLIADEPTTALDVTIQAQILELLKDLQKKMDMGIIIITHDLGVVAQVCDEVDVMYAGRIVERGTVEEIFYNPKHEYTKGLMKSIPQANDTRERLVPIEGNPVDVFRLPKGCSFAPRCESCMKICLKKYPAYLKVNDKHETACFKYYLEAYKNHQISKEAFLKAVDASSTGTASFKPLTHFDVLDAYNDYLLADRMYRHVAQRVKNFTKEEQEAIYYVVKERKANWKRERNDYRMSIKTKERARKDIPSMERGDMAKKIKEAKKRVRFESDENVKHKDLYEFLDNFVITSYPVNFRFHRENVLEAQFEYERAKLFIKIIDQKDNLQKAKALEDIEEKKSAYEDAIDTYNRMYRVTRKLYKTYHELMRINAHRVMDTIHRNAINAYKEFKAKHLMFTKPSELDKYLDGFVYTHWDINEDITYNKALSLYKDWQRKQAKIHQIRDKNHAVSLDRYTQKRNAQMYKFWAKNYDLKIMRFYKKQESFDQYESRHNRALALFKKWQKDQADIYQIYDKSDLNELYRTIREKNDAMFKYWIAHYDLKILRYYKKEKRFFEHAIMDLNKRNRKKARIIYRNMEAAK